MRWCLPFAAVLVLAGCGHEAAQARQIERLSEDLTRVQHDNEAMSDRIASLEIEAASLKDQNKDNKEKDKKASPAATPALPVVHLGASEGSSSLAEDPDDLQPRPVIRVQGSRAKGTPPLIEQTMPEEGAPAPQAKPSALDPAARKAYDDALALVNAKKYDAGLEAFSAFLVRWPDHPYADNATYWRGECYFAKGEYARALEQFEGLVARFPLGNKVPDALLKAGIAQQKLGNPQKASASFDKLRRDYPKSDAAARIPTTQTHGSQVAP